ncbi:cytochrome P460 family protein [Pseudoalteromonas rubra]|uniref:Cytochrome P460 domain-containing protein n=1 Tax=Pseudoalteromonas rubra TaxID=43658 RepID=A0A0F4QQZ0_9GAMM|nr:cytochrome P460 family protein [Pseudoalteromonas rubra]KJZ10111.1 hypothetical protein TW77_07670 [Pseudoalteromonas rubra]
MKRVLLSMAGSLIAISSQVTADPFGVYPFKIPEQYRAELKGYRTQWKRVTGFEHSGLHWQQFIVVFLNKDARVYESNYLEYLRLYQDYDEDEDEEEPVPNFKSYSEGTIVLKENFSAQSGSPHEALTITMMIKRQPGYSPTHGDWEYVQFDNQGKVLLAGKGSDSAIQKVCASCHESIKERDYIFANFYSKSK